VNLGEVNRARLTWQPGNLKLVDGTHLNVIQKVGKEGYIHGWICVRPPCGEVGDDITHPEYGPGQITAHGDDGLHAGFHHGPKDVILGDEVKPSESELGAARDDDLSYDKAESFLANGDPNSSGIVYNEEARDYKEMVSQRIEKEMSNVSTQDLARFSLGNENYSRLSPKVVQAVAIAGPSALDAGDNDDPAYKFVLADDDGHVASGITLTNNRIDKVGSWVPSDSSNSAAIIQSADTFRKQGMPDKDADRLKTMFTDPTASMTPQERSQYYDPNRISSVKQEANDILTRHRDRLYADLAGNGMMDDEDEQQLRAELVGSLVNLWATSSNDHNVAGLAVQHAAEVEFDIRDAMPWTGSNATLHRQTDEFYAKNKAALHGFVRAQYNLTQQDLKKAGIKNVILYRGMNWNIKNDVPDWALGPAPKATGSGYDGYERPVMVPGSVAALKTSDARPISSWSSDDGEASTFFADYGAGGPGVVIRASVPAERVFSTPRSGNGSLSEREWVVLSTPGNVIVQESGEGADDYNDDDYE
jgi:hypothetical protein